MSNAKPPRARSSASPKKDANGSQKTTPRPKRDDELVLLAVKGSRKKMTTATAEVVSTTLIAQTEHILSSLDAYQHHIEKAASRDMHRRISVHLLTMRLRLEGWLWAIEKYYGKEVSDLVLRCARKVTNGRSRFSITAGDFEASVFPMTMVEAFVEQSAGPEEGHQSDWDAVAAEQGRPSTAGDAPVG